MSLSLLSLSLNGCVTADRYQRSEFSDQILRPRDGSKGLTNRACEAWDEKNECTSYVTRDYLLTDESFRKTASTIGFRCEIGGKFYKICPDKPGFCRTTYRCCGIFCSSHCKDVEVLPVEPYQFLIDAKTRCYNPKAYPNGVK